MGPAEAICEGNNMLVYATHVECWNDRLAAALLGLAAIHWAEGATSRMYDWLGSTRLGCTEL